MLRAVLLDGQLSDDAGNGGDSLFNIGDNVVARAPFAPGRKLDLHLTNGVVGAGGTDLALQPAIAREGEDRGDAVDAEHLLLDLLHQSVLFMQ